MYFKIVCGSNKINLQLLFYGGHGSHFEDRAMHILLSNHIKLFILEAGEPNYNGTNLKLKGIYGQAIMNLQR